MINIIPFVIPIFYFSISWFFPWEIIQWDSSISITYLFDVFFILVSFFVLKPKIRLNVKIGIFSRLFFTSLLALICIYCVYYFKLSAPFKYVDNLLIQILILAPFIEEFLFRFSFYEILKNKVGNGKILLFINSLLFAISHAGALSILPKEFFPYIFFQIGYTFFLGWICAKAKQDSHSIVEPIILHFVFNLLFFLAVTKHII